MLKAVLWIELLMRLHWLNRKHCANDGCCTGSRSQLCPVPMAGAPAAGRDGSEPRWVKCGARRTPCAAHG